MADLLRLTIDLSDKEHTILCEALGDYIDEFSGYCKSHKECLDLLNRLDPEYAKCYAPIVNELTDKQKEIYGLE
jgi:hypothetical protein